MSISKHFKRYFLRGLAVLLPTMVTIWIFVWGYKFILDNISVHINRGLVQLILLLQKLLPEASGWPESVLTSFWVEGAGSMAGFLISLVGVCIVGAIFASVVGKTLWRIIEKFILKTPLLKAVYPHIKQVTDFFLTQPEDARAFSRVVAVQYPMQGIWSVGMVTGTGLKKVVDKVGAEMLSIFIPTSPTPFTGFVIMVAKEQTIDLDISIEEALKFTVSGGVIAPGAQAVGSGKAAE